MKKLRCDKPYDIDEARRQKGLSRRRRKDSRTTAYELTIRVPEEYRTYFEGKKKLTRTVFALNKKDDLKDQINAFEDEKNAELERRLEERGWVRRGDEKKEPGRCMTPIGSYIERYIEIRRTVPLARTPSRTRRAICSMWMPSSAASPSAR